MWKIWENLKFSAVDFFFLCRISEEEEKRERGFFWNSLDSIFWNNKKKEKLSKMTPTYLVSIVSITLLGYTSFVQVHTEIFIIYFSLILKRNEKKNSKTELKKEGENRKEGKNPIGGYFLSLSGSFAFYAL